MAWARLCFSSGRNAAEGDANHMELTVTPISQSIGNASIFTITGGPPNAEIFWSSWLNGVSTGEDHSGYGQYTDADGNFQASGGNWPATLNGRSTVGNWEKRAIVYPADGSKAWEAVADFSVVAGQGGTIPGASPGVVIPTPIPVPTIQTSIPASSSGANSLMTGSTNLFGVNIPAPPIVVYGALIGVGLLLVSSGGSGRR